MRCPACQEETPLGLSRCVHCNTILDAPDQPADASGQSWPPAPWRPEGTAGSDAPTPPIPAPDPLTARPWADPAPTRQEPQPEASETRQEARQPRPWERSGLDPRQPLPAPTPSPWEPTTDDRPLAEEPRPWEPSPDPTPWQPGTLATEPRPGEQPWRYHPPAPPPQQDTARQGFAPPPADPWHPPPAQQPRPRRNTGLLVTAWVIVMIAALAALGIAFWPSRKTPAGHAFSPRPGVSQPSTGSSSDGSTPSSSGSAPAGNAATQASAVNSLLDAMANSRGEFATAMTGAGQCAGLDNAIPVIQKVVGERQSELSTAQSLQVDALASGSQLKEALTRALQASLDADIAYLSWATSGMGCTGTTPGSSDFDNGDQISISRATPAKQDFLQLWTPIAQQNNLPARDADHI